MKYGGWRMKAISTLARRRGASSETQMERCGGAAAYKCKAG